MKPTFRLGIDTISQHLTSCLLLTQFTKTSHGHLATKGPAQIKKFMQQMIEAEPDFSWRITNIVDGGSTVAAEWTWTATFTGDTPSGPVAGYHTTGRGASVVVIENGRVKRFADYYDFASFFPKTSGNSAKSNN